MKELKEQNQNLSKRVGDLEEKLKNEVGAVKAREILEEIKN